MNESRLYAAINGHKPIGRYAVDGQVWVSLGVEGNHKTENSLSFEAQTEWKRQDEWKWGALIVISSLEALFIKQIGSRVWKEVWLKLKIMLGSYIHIYIHTYRYMDRYIHSWNKPTISLDSCTLTHAQTCISNDESLQHNAWNQATCKCFSGGIAQLLASSVSCHSLI